MNKRVTKLSIAFLLLFACGTNKEPAVDQGSSSPDNTTSDLRVVDEGTAVPDMDTTSDQGEIGTDTDIKPEQSRSFYMGFTPWPYDFTVEAVLDTYAKANAHGDLIAHHLDNGIPWEEALTNQPYHPKVEEELAFKLEKTGSDKKVYLAINSLNLDRNGLAPYWAANDNSPLPEPWASRSFSDPEVAQAYINYALDLIDRFNPTWFNYGIEANELILNKPEAFDGYVTFASAVYQAIRAAHPDLKILISSTLKHPDSHETMTVINTLPAILPYVDMIGISTYPYVFYGHPNAGDPANLPQDWLSQAQLLAGGKPLALAETGWPAQDLVIPAFSIDTESTADFQKSYTEVLFEEAQNLNLEFIVWYSAVDFDALWNALPTDSDASLYIKALAHIWRDTGLWGEDLKARPALSVWDSWYQTPHL